MKAVRLRTVLAGIALLLLAGAAQAQFFNAGTVSMGVSSGMNSNVQDMIRIGRITDGQPIIDKARIASITTIAVEENGKRMAFGMSDGSVRLWDTTLGQETRRITTGDSAVVWLAFAPAGDMVATLGEKGGIGVVKLSSGAVSALPAVGARGKGLAVTRDGSRVFVSFDDGTVRSIPTAGQGPTTTAGQGPTTLFTDPKASGHALALNDAGTKLALGGSDGSVRLIDVATGQATAFGETDSKIKAISFARDGDKVLVADDDGKVMLVGPKGVEKKTSVSDDDLLTVAVSRDGRFFAAGGEDKRLHVVDMTTGNEVNTGDKQEVPITAVTFASSDKVVLSGGTDGIAHIFDREKATPVAQVVVGKTGWVVLGKDGEFDSRGGTLDAVKWGNEQAALDMEQFTSSHYEPGLLMRAMKAGPDETHAAKEATMAAEVRPSLAKSFSLPPVLNFAKSLGDSNVTTEKLTVSFTAKDQGGGIDEVRLFQNGQVVMSDNSQAGKESPVGGDDGVTLAAKTTLVKGMNEFKVVALSRERIESKPVLLKITYTPPLTASVEKAPELHVVTVGINKYKNPALNLDYGVPDANGIADFFIGQRNGLFSKVVKHALYDQQATHDNVIEMLSGLSTLAPEDVAVIYLAGHGETIGTTWYFIPHDMTRPEKRAEIEEKGIPSTQIDAMVQKIGARKVVLMIDACKSGAALLSVRGFEERKALVRLARATGVHIMAAAARDQYAAELPSLGHGIFTYTILQGLSGKAARTKDGTVSIRELTNFVEERLPQLSEEHANSVQFPIIDSRGMDFPIATVTQ
ncbi:MAG: caspase family protein [Alphaproteobacteria bacterium]